MGTTNTRAWLMCGERIIASSRRAIGVRDAARAGSSQPIRDTLHDLLAELTHSQRNEGSCPPTCVAAAGMIGSSLGIREIPHVSAPAGIEELTAAAQWLSYPEITALPILLVPGVRTGSSLANTDQVREIDVMRGEETICAGLIAAGTINPPAVVIGLGSHWKTIELEQNGKIAKCTTSLSGELVHAVQLQTILSSSISTDPPQHLAPEWLEAGMREQRRSGLGRALFCARLLDLEGQGTKQERLTFTIGAFIASDLDPLLSSKVLSKNLSVFLVGSTAITEAWQWALLQHSISATVVSQRSAEEALLLALRKIASAALVARNYV